MTDFAAALGDRLDRLAARHGATAFWLRDDDAQEPSDELDRLITIAGERGVPLALAVIPQGASDALARRIAAVPHVCVLQHGYTHANHAPPSQKKTELGDHRPVAAVLAELDAGKARLAAFAQSLPVLVPPWNRIGPQVAANLALLGYAGLSLYGERRRNPAAPGLRHLNTHLDLFDWRAGRRFQGAERLLELLGERLDRLLSGDADPAEPTGILAHHRVHDAQTFKFLSSLLEYLSQRDDCRFPSVAELIT